MPETAVPILRLHDVTITGGSPAFYIAFLAEQRKDPGTPLLPNLRVLAGGGAPEPAILFHQVLDEMGVRILHGYGMTESPMITDGSVNDTDEQLANTEGSPIRGMEDVVAEHPAVAAVAVIGLPDDERGERVCAVIEVVGDHLPTLAEIAAHCRAAVLPGWRRRSSRNSSRSSRPCRATPP